jgi:hypothetical protein
VCALASNTNRLPNSLDYKQGELNQQVQFIFGFVKFILKDVLPKRSA